MPKYLVDYYETYSKSYEVEANEQEKLEECEKEQLDEREQYWQEYFQARSFGYSIK